MTLGIIGSGNIGSTVAHLAVAAGHEVVVSNSRGPETLADLVAELGPLARAATAAEAAAAGDLVLVTVPLKAIGDLPADALTGKVVLDTCNYYPERDGQVAALDAKETTTSELVQQALPGSTVVKVFNNIFFKALRQLARPAGAADRSALLIAGDDADAKARVTALLDAIGYDAADAGSLADSWRFERDTPAYGVPYATDGDWSTPKPTTADELLAAVAQASS